LLSKVRFHSEDPTKAATATDPNYIEGFSNGPKLNRTPNTTLVGIPGEFDPPPQEFFTED